MADISLFRRLLGQDYAALPGSVRAVHDASGPRLLAGRSTIERRPGFFAWALCAAMGLPEAGNNVVVTVELIRRDGSEIWKRQFGGRRYQSTLSFAPEDNLRIVERFGPFDLTFALEAKADRLIFDLRESRFLGFPLPRFLSPRCLAEEREEKGYFVFDVPLDLPLLGRILRYQGWLITVEGNGASDRDRTRPDNSDAPAHAFLSPIVNLEALGKYDISV